MSRNGRVFLKVMATLSVSIILSSCASNYVGISTKVNECGMGTAKFSTFQDCAHSKLGFKEDTPKDYYTQSRRELLGEIDSLAVQVKKKKKSEKDAYAALREYLSLKAIEEQRQGQTAAAIIGVMALGAGAAACANSSGGCLGGNSYNSYYNGNCECPKDIARDGSICGARSAWSRSGGATPYCPPGRI